MEALLALLSLALTFGSMIVPFAGLVMFVMLAQRLGSQQRTDLAAELGLERIGDRLHGEIDGVQVEAWTERRGGKNKVTFRVIRLPIPGLPPEVRVLLGSQGSVDQDLRVGDPAFDTAYRVDVDGVGWAWLGAGSREILRRARGSLTNGALLVEERGDLDASFVRARAADARALRVDDPERRLWELAEEDPAAYVRAHALAAIWATWTHPAPPAALGRFDTRRGAERAVATAWRDGHLGLAARELDGDDRYVVATILAERGPARAIEDLVAEVQPGAARPLWFRLTEGAALFLDEPLGRAVVEAADRLADDPFGADRAAAALVGGAAPWREPWLAHLLPRLDKQQDEALAWLEAHGTVASVPALDRVLAGAWPMSDARERAQRARRAIQGRASGERGGLAIAEDSAAGGVSVAEARGGELALPTRSGQEQ